MLRSLALCCVSVFACACNSSAFAQEALKLVRTIPLEHVEGRIDHLSITPDGRRLFVAALGNNSVEIVDTDQATRTAGIENLSEPQGVCYIGESAKLTVTSGGDNRVFFFDRALKPIGTVKDLDDADNARYDPASKLLYVGYGDGALAIIDPDKAMKVGDVKLDGHPESFQLESNGSRIFVNVPGARHIEVVDRQKRTVIAKWPVNDAQANFPMSLDEANHRLFVGCRKPARLLVLNTDNGKTIAALDCCGDSDDVFYDATARRIYVSGGEGCVSVFEQSDADHYKLLEKIKTATGARTSLFDADRGRLYIAVPHRGTQPAELRVYLRAQA